MNKLQLQHIIKHNVCGKMNLSNTTPLTYNSDAHRRHHKRTYNAKKRRSRNVN